MGSPVKQVLPDGTADYTSRCSCEIQFCVFRFDAYSRQVSVTSTTTVKPKTLKIQTDPLLAFFLLPTPSFVERHSRFLSAATLFVSFLIL